ncbi:unnamed protein product [Dibothriocephalus latus]|uniref:DM domain-containing protein n=1 Tax=Dibothriocephalus latus TaxID=60516 RepID=A0A3P7LFR6_DIBLA|nr:unnamed protein product [Dibothriocephalus latus]
MLTGPAEKAMKGSAVEEEGPHCRRCRNHGKTNPWKGHKKACPFYYCICQQCILITLRKSNEKNLREVVQEVNKDGGIRLPLGVPPQPPIIVNTVNNSTTLIPPACEDIFHQPNSSLFLGEQTAKVDTEESTQVEKSSLVKFPDSSNCFKMPLMHFAGATVSQTENCRKPERTPLMTAFEDSCPMRQRVTEDSSGQPAKFPFTAGYPWILRDSLNYAFDQSSFASSADTPHEAQRAAAIAAAAAAAVAFHHKASFKHAGLPINCLSREEAQSAVESGKAGGQDSWNCEFPYQLGDFGVHNADSTSSSDNRACFVTNRTYPPLKWDSALVEEAGKQEHQRLLPSSQPQDAMMEGTAVAEEAAAVEGDCRNRTAEWNVGSAQDEEVAYKNVKDEQDPSPEVYNAMLTRHGCWGQANFRTDNAGTLLRSAGKLDELLEIHALYLLKSLNYSIYLKAD